MSRQARSSRTLSAPTPPLSPLPPPYQSARGGWRFGLPLILVAYLCLASVHAMMLPPGATGYQNAPDEAAHVAFVRAIGSGHLPTQATGAASPIGYEWHQPPLYYGLASLFLSGGDRALRIPSLLCGLAAIVLIYLAARLLAPDDPVLAILAAGLAAFTPSHIALTSVVNNDALLEVCFSGALLAILGAFHGGFTTWRAGWLGIAISAAILTKANGLLLLPIFGIACYLLWRNGDKPTDLLRNAGWTLLIVVATTSWWFVRNTKLYGQPLPLSAFQTAFAGTVQARDVASGAWESRGLHAHDWPTYFLLVAQWTFQSYWAVYGTPLSAQIGAPRWLPGNLYLLCGLASLTALCGLIRLHFERRTRFTQTQLYVVWLFFITVGIVALSFLAFLLRYFQPQGRYLYPAMLPLCLLFALGWRAVFPKRYRDLSCGLLLMFLAAISLAWLRTILLAVQG